MRKHRYHLSYKIWSVIKEGEEVKANEISKRLEKEFDVIKNPFEVASCIRVKLKNYVGRRRIKPSTQHYVYFRI